MDAQKANYEITRMARLLGVTRQGYYAWQHRREQGPGPRAERRERIDQAVREAFHASDDVYGAPRITRELAAGGVVVDRKMVAASMRRQGLEGISPRMFTPVTTIQDPAARGFADHAERQWDKGRLDAVWTSDIPPQAGGAPTYLPTGEGWLFLADPGRSPPRGRSLDRDRLQPSPAALQPRLHQPGRIREHPRPRPGRDRRTHRSGPSSLINRQ